MTTAPVRRATEVGLAPEEAFRLFTEQIGAWWPLATHGAFGASSGGLAFEDGRLVERSVAGERLPWGDVLAWEPPRRLVISWRPGRPDGPASQVEVLFLAVAAGTRVELAHSGWEAHGAQAGHQRDSHAGRDAWGHVLDHYADLILRAPARGATVDDEALEQLEQAYEAFFAEALAGGFATPADGGFTAEQVVAHVAVNDDAMSAVCRAVIQGAGHADGARPCARFENAVANDRAVLQRFVESHGGRMATVVAAGRGHAEQFRLLLARLDDTEREVAVHAHLASDGELMVDDDLPWGRLAMGVQTLRHLPGHAEQLRALRADPA